MSRRYNHSQIDGDWPAPLPHCANCGDLLDLWSSGAWIGATHANIGFCCRQCVWLFVGKVFPSWGLKGCGVDAEWKRARLAFCEAIGRWTLRRCDLCNRVYRFRPDEHHRHLANYCHDGCRSEISKKRAVRRRIAISLDIPLERVPLEFVGLKMAHIAAKQELNKHEKY